jgi:hypothetical protein
MSAIPLELRPGPVGRPAGADPSAGPARTAVHDRDVLAAVAAGAVAGGLVAAVVTTRRPAPVRTISMGPGGWVSFRGTGVPRRIRTTSARRPRWAHLLGARRLRQRQGPRRRHG